MRTKGSVHFRKDMKNTAMDKTEPSAELRLLAEMYLEQHAQLKSLPSDELMNHWCKFLQSSAPELLELPLMHLVKVIVAARKKVSDQRQVTLHCA